MAPTPRPGHDLLYNRCLIKAPIHQTLTLGQACAKHLGMVSRCILTVTLSGRDSYYPGFAREETEAQRHTVHGSGRIQSQICLNLGPHS